MSILKISSLKRAQDQQTHFQAQSAPTPIIAGKDALNEHLVSRIPGAQLFELDGVADTTHSVPHMLPSEAVFSATMDALGITQDTTVVVYDRFPSLYSSPRVWWTFRVFGHQRYVMASSQFLRKVFAIQRGWLRTTTSVCACGH